jgi:serine/threonine protein phosphatase PrpC
VLPLLVQVFQADLLLPVPECRSISLLPGHEFLIIASDGLWDVVSGTEAVTRAKSALAAGKNASEAAEELCDLALKLGSSDNVTAVIVQFIHN